MQKKWQESLLFAWAVAFTIASVALCFFETDQIFLQCVVYAVYVLAAVSLTAAIWLCALAFYYLILCLTKALVLRRSRKKLMNIMTGTAVCVILVVQGVLMARRAGKEMKKLQEEQG